MLEHTLFPYSNRVSSTLFGEGVKKKTFFFGTLSQTMGLSLLASIRPLIMGSELEGTSTSTKHEYK